MPFIASHFILEIVNVTWDNNSNVYFSTLNKICVLHARRTNVLEMSRFYTKKHCCRIRSNWVRKIVGRAIFFARLLWNVSKSHIGKVLRGPLTQQIENWRPFPFRLFIITPAYMCCFVTLLLLPPVTGPRDPDGGWTGDLHHPPLSAGGWGEGND